MIPQSHDYLEISFRSIQCFSNDGKLDVHELNQLVDVALRDGAIDDEERRVLAKIIGLLKPEELTAEMLARIAVLKSQYAIA